MADNVTIQDGEGIAETAATDELSDNAQSPKVTLLSGDGTPTPISPATTGNQIALATLVGAVTETAPATDTASSGLNGRLQRIAQRITSFIALLPTSLGGKTAAASFPVVLSSDGPFALQTGSITETAPATDTASSGLNGRLQRIAQRLTSFIALLPTALGQGTMAQSLRVVLPSDQSAVPMSQSGSGLATYYASGLAYGAYATPEDMLVLTGSATKIIRIINMRMLVHTTTGALQTVHFIKRSAANTGGTATNPVGIPVDSADPAATASLSLYTVLPTLGAAVATLVITRALTTVATAAPGIFTLVANITGNAPGLYAKPIILRGVAESLAINWGAAALPAGFAAQWDVIWTESNI